jgi:hypothetical protein
MRIVLNRGTSFAIRIVLSIGRIVSALLDRENYSLQSSLPQKNREIYSSSALCFIFKLSVPTKTVIIF